jgi:Xaa-Pro aminopeptidase
MRGPKPNRQESAARLAAFTEKLPSNSVAIFVSNPEETRSRDTEFEYRQSSDILYLNGFPEPQSVLIVSKLKGTNKVTMLVRPKDAQQERWTGIRQGLEGAKEHYLADDAKPIAEFKKVIRKLIKKAKRIYYASGHNTELDEVFEAVWSAKKRKRKKLRNPETIVHEMRLFKSEGELELMRQASEISAEAHRDVMAYCRPGMNECELQAVAECTFTSHGADAPSYNTIMAGGPRATVLHYTDNSQRLEDGQLVLNDSACEYQGYASDITRTFPVNGRFSQAQREIYELVLKAQVAAVDAAKPGIRLGDLHDLTKSIMTAGLIELGILPKPAEPAGDAVQKVELTKKERKQQAKQAKKAAKKSKQEAKQAKKDGNYRSAAPTITDFFMHGTSHWIGIDVHDVGSYETEDGTRSDKGKGKRRMLEPGMAFTVEPGLYFDADDTRVPEQYRGIGVRIEDIVVITEDGRAVLTSAVPKTVDQIEALMARSRDADVKGKGKTGGKSPDHESYPRHFPGIH